MSGHTLHDALEQNKGHAPVLDVHKGHVPPELMAVAAAAVHQFRSVKLLVHVATGKTLEVYADRRDTVADLKRRIDEREGFAPGAHELCRPTRAQTEAITGGPKLDVQTKSLKLAVDQLPAESEARAQLLDAWLSNIDAKVGKAKSGGSKVAAPRAEALVLLDDWDVARCRFREGEPLTYGPWCPSQSGAARSADDGAAPAIRTERVGSEHERILDALVERKNQEALQPEPEPAGHVLSKEEDASHRAMVAKLGGELQKATSRGFVDEVKERIAKGCDLSQPRPPRVSAVPFGTAVC